MSADDIDLTPYAGEDPRFCACGARVDDQPECHLDDDGVETCAACCKHPDCNGDAA